MPPYLRRRRLWGQDWFAPREIQHLPWRDKERMIQAAGAAVRHHPRYWLMARLLPLLGILAMSLASLVLLLKMSTFLYFLLAPLFPIQVVTGIIWRRRHFRAALRQMLLDAGIRPGVCFECGYDVEGFKGNDCPACDAALLRQADSSSESA